jgi:hypothetical protein
MTRRLAAGVPLCTGDAVCGSSFMYWMSLRSDPSALFGDARRVSDRGMYYSGVPSVVLSILEAAVYRLLIHPSFNEIVCEAR